ncbi:MAG: cellulase N-terminal Ig-like domain-containing protein, partial [Candidatus Acidiferrales bacterium]
LLAFVLAASRLGAAPVSHAIKLDYFGYRTGDAKVAIVSANPGASVQVRRTDDSVAFTIPTDGGSIASKGSDGVASGDSVWWVDFSGFTTPGTYRLYSASLGGQSYDFEIRDDWTAPLE